MKIVDLSHTIQADMPVYPGTAQPVITQAYSIAKEGFAETMLHMVSHTGTHMDAPSHMLEDGLSLDQMPAEKFFGMALIIDYPPCAGERIELEPLQQMREKIERAEYVLFNTGHSQKWGHADYFDSFPTLTPEAAAYLATFPLKGLGIDAIGFDPVVSEHNPVHHILFSAGFVLLENLVNLQQVQGEYCMFGAMPLKYKDADGSPVRAFAIEMDTTL